MTIKTILRRFGWLLFVPLWVALSACSASRTLAVPDLDTEQSVKLFLTDGSTDEGLILERTGTEVTLVSEADHETHTYRIVDVRRVEMSQKIYDHLAYPISNAEVEKYKKSRNTWAYGIGGGVISGLAGIGVGIPIWLANDNPPPYFVGGITAVVGSIYFATRGRNKDQSDAIEMVRVIRLREGELEQAQQSELERLQQLEREKKELLQKLDKKKEESENRQSQLP